MRLSGLSFVLLLTCTAGALALPRGDGDAVPAAEVVDLDGKPRAIPDPARPLLLFYEDQNAGKQNERAREVLGRLLDEPRNHGRIDCLAIADVEKWNFWPARRYALAELRKVARRENTVLYCDWQGRLRRVFGLTRGKSGVLLIGSDGKCWFAREGQLSDAELTALLSRLAELGIR
jgi:hypothetical protein